MDNIEDYRKKIYIHHGGFNGNSPELINIEDIVTIKKGFTHPGGGENINITIKNNDPDGGEREAEVIWTYSTEEIRDQKLINMRTCLKRYKKGSEWLRRDEEMISRGRELIEQYN